MSITMTKTPPASWRLIAKAAINLLCAIDERHDNNPPPLKYSVPYGAVNDLRRALGAADPAPSEPEAQKAVARIKRGAQTPWGFAGILVEWLPGLQDLPPGEHEVYASPSPAASMEVQGLPWLDWLNIHFREVSMDFYEGERCFYVQGLKGSFKTLRDALAARLGKGRG